MRCAAWLLAPAAMTLLPLTQTPAQAGTLPDWVARLPGTYVGRDHNDGQLQCERLVFRLQNGVLTGHYWVGASDPFEGELIDFVPEPGTTSGRFTWVDRYGRGVRVIRWAPDLGTFFSLWGADHVERSLTGYGLRGEDAVVPGCNGTPTS